VGQNRRTQEPVIRLACGLQGAHPRVVGQRRLLPVEKLDTPSQKM